MGKLIKGLLILIFIVFVFMPFFNFWVEYPLFAGTLIIIFYLILSWAEGHIPYFKKRKKDKDREENKKGV